MRRLFQSFHTAAAAIPCRSAGPIRNPRITSLVPLIHVRKPSLALDASHLRVINETLETKGALQLQLGFIDDESTYLHDLIQALHRSCGHGLPITHSAERGWFWDVRPSKENFQSHEHQARSETMKSFDWHTDCSYEESLPRYFALQVLQPDRCGGGTLSVLNVAQLLTLLSPFARRWLSSPNFKIMVPPEFIKNPKEVSIVGNILATNPGGSGGQLRYREDITIPLTENAAQALDELKAVLNSRQAKEETLHLTAEMLPRGSIIMMDNQRWLHARNEINDPKRHLRRVRWNSMPFGMEREWPKVN